MCDHDENLVNNYEEMYIHYTNLYISGRFYARLDKPEHNETAL